MRFNSGWAWTALAILSAVFVILATLQYWSMEEDAFILFRYAESAAHGNGLYFNGDYGSPERVAGYSNIVWILILTLVAKLGIHTPAGARAVLLLISSLNLILLYYLTKRITGEHRPLNLLPPLLLATNVCYLWYAPGGMEPALFIFLAQSAFLAFIYEEQHGVKFPYSAILFALLTMTHPEGPLYFLAAVAWRGARRWRNKEIFLRDGVWFFTFWTIYFGFLIWHLGYYRDPFPTTFYNKGVGHPQKLLPGLKHLLSFFLDSRGYILLLPILALPLRRKWDRLASPRPPQGGVAGWLVALFVLAGVGFILVCGGDSKTHYRFIIPFMPFLFVLVAAGLARLGEWMRNKRALAVAVIASLAVILAVTNTVLFDDFVPRGNMLTANIAELVKNPRYLIDKWRYSFAPYSHHPSTNVGRWMKENLPPDSYIATGQTGNIPYYAEMTCLDIMGFNDKIIQKIRMERNWGYNTYILARKPDYLGDYDVMMRQYGDRLAPTRLVEDPDFIANYELYAVIDTDRAVRGESIGIQRFVLFKRREQPVALEGWEYEEALERFISKGENVLNYSCDYILPPGYEVSEKDGKEE